MDISEPLLRSAAANFPANAKPNLIVGDLNRIRDYGQSYDIVICVSGLHHIVELESVLKFVHDVLAESGEFWSIGEAIGRNGNRLWARDYEVANTFFRELPDRLRQNRISGNVDDNLPDTLDGQVYARQCAEPARHAPCIFEYVYLARPDSMIEDVSVYKARLRMGEKLAAKILRLRPDHGIDAVIPIPDTSRTAASSLAQALGVPMREGFVKNRYIGRTFIMPGQSERVKSVRRKLNAIGLEFRKKNVLLVDDSIVRGTTSKQIIQMAREAGAKSVYFASAAPPVRHPNIYGIDMPAAAELVAHGHSEAEIEKLLGADWLVYQDLDDLVAAVAEGNDNLVEFDTSCFSGEYVTGVEATYLDQLEFARSDEAKSRRRQPG